LSVHHTEDGQPCTLHAELPRNRLYELALAGSRIPGFHHDAASKLQSLMMAVDEISEYAAEHPVLRMAVTTAQASLQDLRQMLSANRELTTSHQRMNVPLAEVLEFAAQRVGVQLRGSLVAADILVSVPAMIYALGELLDLVAGPIDRARTVDVVIEPGHHVTWTISGPRDVARTTGNAPEIIALASFALAREHGSLVCGGAGERFRLSLPRP
jgi:hypothetical protein